MQVKGMAHFCGFIKLIFLLLILARIPCNETRPLKENAQANSDLIAGNEFLKLFMEHDHLERDLTSSEFIGSGSGGDNTAAEKTKKVAGTLKKDEQFDKKLTETGRRSSSSRSLKDKGPKLNQAEGQLEDSKQVVKLVTSGSKIVFLEDYDVNDAILDAEVRDIDLKKEIFTQDNHPNLDEYKVVAVSVSSSSQRGTTATRNNFNKFEKRPSTTSTTTTTSKPFVMAAPKKTTATTVRSQSSAASLSNEPLTKAENMAADNFINRSHKSEFSIEEVEPLTMTQQQARKNHARHRTYPRTNVADTMEALDSENSASTNIHNILAAPLQSSASARSTSTVTSIYHSGQRNMTINHHEPNLHVMQARHKTAVTANTANKPSNEGDLQQQQQIHTTSDGDGDVGGGVEDQLLPFQTVIYHDTKAGHGPQSRSISYSSISQNVEDLKKWQQSGILAEARRNVSESLKPMPKFNTTSTNEKPEPAKFYSQPSKMYSEPSKFYSEPAKVYSEPAKVYGEPEKFYSEPAKVYGQPSKFYSEPSKVYSQPAKVYSEPAKVYWPILSDTTTTTTNTITSTQSPSKIEPSTAAVTTAAPTSINLKQSSKKPAIVSRIAFGEAHLISSSTSTTTTTTTTTAPLITTSRTYGSHSQHQYSSRTDISHRKASTSSSSFSLNNQNSSLSSSSTPSRRILFNLDRLPYDLLNAPEPSIQQQQLLELQKTKRPQQTLTYQQQRQQQQEQAQQKQQQQQQQQPQHQQQHQQQKKQRHHINPCLESAVSSLFSSSTLSAHPTLQKQRQQQQHPSVPDQQQHSNQNAKGLPNGDLVKCVAEISHTSAADTDDDDDDDDSDDRVGGVEVLTTERNHLEELFAPTPERNYEIEESVSVMTNGRAHSVVGGGRNSFAHPTTSPIHQQQHHGFKPNRQRTRVHFGTNVNNPTEIRDDGHPHLPQLSQASYNTNANSNANTKSNNNNNSNQRNHNAPEYNQYDDANNNDNNDSDNDNGNDGAAKNNDYEDDDGSPPANGNNGDGSSDEDSKVAYIVEGHNYRKYRVEEETDDGFIVGEYGVVDHNDGNLRGVRYTADSTINRSLIQKALLTFLKLK